MEALATRSQTSDWISRVRQTRAETLRICDPLVLEDFGVQSMPEVSPPKWHLAHTSWFLEHFALAPHIPGYRRYHPEFSYLFNSYYEAVGPYLERSRRGLLSRPTVQEVFRYRQFVDAMLDQLEADDRVDAILELSFHHEQQHQELLVTDIKHIFWTNPLKPVYRREDPEASRSRSKVACPEWIEIPEGLYEIGFDETQGFSFDNERPRHPVFVGEFEIQDRLVTNEDYLGFIEAGGYSTPKLWLSRGWELIQQQRWKAPLYWSRSEDSDSGWSEFTLSGQNPLELSRPVMHLSYYEADAYARWKGARLPSEAEWEVASESLNDPESLQFWGEAWQWTASSYEPYPGFKPLSGELGEYNGKFMSNQMVLRGGSSATSPSHIRTSYRNFFSPETRWQFSGLRLAR